MSLPEVLHVAEQARHAGAAPDRGTVVIATLQGDVHHIGKALLGALLRTTGYQVVDVGKEAPVEAVVRAAIDCRADAIGLSALLVTSSRQIPLCVQALDEHGVHVPVLIGGAAMNRTFGRTAGLLPDGRTYTPGVFYCRDVFEGLQTLDDFFVGRARTFTEKDAVAAGTPMPGKPTRVRRVEPPQPPRLGPSRIRADLREVWRHLDLNTLFRHHWGGFPVRGPEYERLVHDQFEPELARLQADALTNGWLEALMVGGYFRCRSDRDALVISDLRFEFPRQTDGEHLCLADYFSPQEDVLPLQAVSTGRRPARYLEQLEDTGQYVRMLYVNGLSAASAEAMADYAHAHARRELGLAADRGLRFSWGYAACPDLSQQHDLLALLDADREIGLRLTESETLDPEHSTAAMIVHHPDAKYFSAVRAA
ncbi:MAG: cobalamin-dependent protein [Chloroflexi bacterium]|nr:cobalamin-dependent protein [Chloroflexota bacterium]